MRSNKEKKTKKKLKSIYWTPKGSALQEMMFIKNKSLEQGLNLSRS
jgi:hypothetical protein